MPCHLLPLTVQLLPVQSLLYCLTLIFVSAIKFFLVFIHDFGCFKLFQPRIELKLPGFVTVLEGGEELWGIWWSQAGLGESNFPRRNVFPFLLSSLENKSSSDFALLPPLGALKCFSPNNLNSKHEPDIENNLFDILMCRERRVHCKNTSGLVIPDKLLIIPDELLIGNG